jgi:hypothetical protein
LSFRSPSENSAHRAAATSITDRDRSLRCRLLPWGFFPFSVSPPRAAAFNNRASHSQSPAPPGFLNLLALRSAPSLLALFHARSAHGVRPSEPSSSRAAVRRLRRLCPPDVATPSNQARGPPSQSRMPKRRAWNPTIPIMGRPLKRPSSSGLCSTRESATPGRLFRPTQARSSPGFHPLQGVPPHRNGTAFTAPTLLRLSSQATNRPTGRPYRVFLPGEVGLSLSRLPTLMGFPTS